MRFEHTRQAVPQPLWKIWVVGALVYCILLPVGGCLVPVADEAGDEKAGTATRCRNSSECPSDEHCFCEAKLGGLGVCLAEEPAPYTIATCQVLAGSSPPTRRDDAADPDPDPDPAPSRSAGGFVGRIAVSADGNIHDQDDWGATPASLAIIAHANLRDRLVHYDFNSHVPDSTDRGEAAMRESALGGARRFGFDEGVFFDDQSERQGAIRSIANAINQSSERNPLSFVVAGPMEIAWQGINASERAKRPFVTVISHSNWNNDHVHNNTHDADDVRALGVNFDQIGDQNTGLNTAQNWSPWEWLRHSENNNLNWVYQRMQAVGKADISDAGMIYYVIRDDQSCTPAKLRDWFGE